MSQGEIDEVFEAFRYLDTDNSGYVEFYEVCEGRDTNYDGMIDLRNSSSMDARGT